MDPESVVSQDHRKIELQSNEDLAYLIANVRRAAAERLNEAFPHVEGEDGEDELRNKIEELVNEVLLSQHPFHLRLSALTLVPVHQQDILPRLPEYSDQRPPSRIRLVPRRHRRQHGARAHVRAL